jgi:hypothetical protein
METIKQKILHSTRNRQHYTERRNENVEALYRAANGYLAINDGLPSAIRALTTVLKYWTLGEYKRLASVNDDEDLKFHDQVIERILDTIELVGAMAGTIEDINFYERQLDELKKEVQNG